MYIKYSVYTTLKQAELIEDAVCGIYDHSEKFGSDRRLYVERKIEEFLSDCIKKWEKEDRRSEI